VGTRQWWTVVAETCPPFYPTSHTFAVTVVATADSAQQPAAAGSAEDRTSLFAAAERSIVP